MGLRIENPGDFTIFRSKERPWLCCTPDRLLYDGVQLVAGIEIKCAWYESAKEWSEKVPLAYQVQGQHTMYVLGVDTLYFAALLNGCSFKWHPMKRHEGWIQKTMLPRLDAFWQSIQRGEYPNVDASESTARALAARYPNPDAGQVELEAEWQELAEEYDKLLERSAEDDKRKLEIANLAKERLGQFEVGILQDGTAFCWKQNGKGRRFTRSTKLWRTT